jgi:TonB family protein
MYRFAVGGVGAILLLHVSMLPNATRQQSKEISPASTVPLPSYPESPDGLKKLIEDIFGTIKSGNSEKASLYFLSLTIPDHNAWFVKTFGPAEGPRLETKYEELLPQAPNHIRQTFEYALKDARTDVGVSVLQKPAETSSGLGRATIEAMVQPTPLYIVVGTSPQQRFPVHIGEFIYVDGAFRYLDQQVSQALSSAPPLRIRVGGNVQGKNIIRQVMAQYPKEARSKHIQGTVVLHVVIDRDGSMLEVQPVMGPEELRKAAVDAVKQWRYEPTLLNGEAVQVDPP